MVFVRICAITLSLLVLLTTSNTGLAQASDSIEVIGSGIVNSLIENRADTSESSAVNIKTTGTAAGIDRFCNGDIDMATASRTMTSGESAICGANSLIYSEFVIGHRILAFVAHSDAQIQCLTLSDLDTLIKPSAGNMITDWSFYDEEQAEMPLTLLIPQDSSIEYAIVDGLVIGDGLRSDLEFYAEASEALARVNETAGALGLLPWTDDLTGNEQVILLGFRDDDAPDCVQPSAETVEAGDYGAALSLYVYVNRARLSTNDSFSQFLAYILDPSNAADIAAAGFTPPSSATYDLNARILTDQRATVGEDGVSMGFVVPDDLGGNVTIAGAALAFDVFNSVADRLPTNNIGLEIALEFRGQVNGIERLCMGDADIAVLDMPLDDSAMAECAESGIADVPLQIGAQATVLLANVADEHTACLTTDQINTIWRADSSEIVTNWSNVDASFPDQPMTLFGLSTLDQHSDILLQSAGRIIPPIRRDTEIDFDPLYRAAAVGNVTGALTYMSWRDYQRVLDKDQADIQLVAVDAGSGCVQPSPSAIDDGSYALSRRASLLVREESLSDVNVQSFLWSLFDEDNWSVVERQDFIGISSIELPAIRRELQTLYAKAEADYPPAEETDEIESGDESLDEDSSE